MEVLGQRRRVREEVLMKARRWAEELLLRATAVLVGSYARGDFNLWSDVDILLILEFTGRPLDRLEGIECPAGFEIIPLTPQEFQRLVERGDGLALEAKLSGVILRDDLGLFNL